MVVTHYGNQQYYGLSSDTKPLVGDTAVNATFEEYDTSNRYINNGTTWLLVSGGGGGITASSTATFTNKELDIDATGNKLRNFHQASWIIYRPSAGGTIKSYNVRTGVVDYSHASELNTVLQSTLDAAGYSTIYISDHLTGGVNYPINATGFTGFQFGYRQHLVMGKNAKIQVPNGYTGVVFKLFNSDAKICFWNTIEGGWIHELGTPLRNWTAFQIYSNRAVSGGDFNLIKGQRIDDCGIAVEFKLDNTAATWCNGNCVKDIQVFYPNIVLDFNSAGTANSGFNRNLFQNILMQGAANTTHGARNVRDQGNVFIDCKFWDIHYGGSTARVATIHPEGDGTIIIGGIMAYESTYGIEDFSNSQNTIIIDQWNIVRHKGNYVLPSLKKVGAFLGSSTAGGDGLFAGGFTGGASQAVTQASSAPDGKYTRYTTAASAGAVAGIRYTNPVAMRSWNSRFKCRFRVNNTWSTDSRLLLGLSTNLFSADPANSDTNLNTESGIMLYTRPADSVFTAGRNNGAATATFSAMSGSPSIDTGIHTFEIWGDERAGQWYWRFDSAPRITVSTLGPGTATALGVTAMVQTTSTTTKALDIFYLEAQSDK